MRVAETIDEFTVEWDDEGYCVIYLYDNEVQARKRPMPTPPTQRKRAAEAILNYADTIASRMELIIGDTNVSLQ